MDTREIELTFGKHRGTRIQRVPASYLLYMVRNETPQANFAQAELDRRGTTIPTVEISGHAIDSASIRCRRIWHEHREKTEGLHSWLAKNAGIAYEACPRDKDRIDHLGVTWVFDHDGRWPVLKTVWRAKEKRDAVEESKS